MARGSGRRTYVRDGNGRFASTGTTTAKARPAARRAATRAGNRLNRDNTGRISGIGRNGATVRGGRLKTAKGNARATQTASMRGAGFRASTIAKGGRGVSGKVARSMAAVRKERAGAQTAQATPMPRRVPAAQRPGSLTSTLRGTLRAVAKADAARIRELEAITGQKVRPTPAGARAGAEAGARVRGTAKGGKVAGTLRAGLRELAQSDARTAREMAAIVRDATPKVAGGEGGKAMKGAKAAAKLTPRKPTPQGPGPRTKAPRPAGTVAKPKGLKVGVLAGRRKREAAPTAAQFSLLSFRAKEKAARIRRRAGSRFAQANEQDRAAIKKARSTKTAGSRKKANKALKSAMVMQNAVRVLTGQITPSATRRPLATRLY